jgi:hypothetical protein
MPRAVAAAQADNDEKFEVVTRLYQVEEFDKAC